MAAIAAAAIASGAVALSDVAVAAVEVSAVAVTGDDGRNGVGRHLGGRVLLRLGLIGGRRRSAADVFDSGFVSSDFVASDFEESDFDLERRVVSLLASASVSLRAAGGGIAVVGIRCARALSDAALSEAAWSDAAVLSRDRLSGGLANRRRGAGGAGAADVSCERLSVLLAAALLSTRAAKLSFPADWSESDRADLAGAP